MLSSVRFNRSFATGHSQGEQVIFWPTCRRQACKNLNVFAALKGILFSLN